MTLDPLDLFTLAEQLHAGGGEARARTAINRAYYACHLAARDRLYGVDAARRTARNQRRPSHIAVVNEVVRALGREPGNRLDRLKHMREVADYIRDSDHPEVQSIFRRESVGDWQELAEQALNLARDILPTLQTMPTTAA